MKIEIEKPVIPQFVADWIEQLYGQGFNSDDLLEAMFSRNYDVAELKIFRWFIDDKERAVIAVLYGYEIEQEPFYYAKIKGWEVSRGDIYWSLIFQEKSVFPQDQSDQRIHKTKLTKKAWNEIGINDTNADFEEVE